MKHEWKKQEKDLYGVKAKPEITYVPRQNFIMIDGKGNPNNTDFSHKVSALYSLAYAVKMGYKSIARLNPVNDFSVYPLEGIWKSQEGIEFVKDKLEYTIMICQPDFITKSMVEEALEKIKAKKPNPLFERIRFDAMEDGKSVQMLHTGSYDDEPASFGIMERFIKQNGFKRRECCHREIYLNNANRTLKSNLKTILRYRIE